MSDFFRTKLTENPREGLVVYLKKFGYVKCLEHSRKQVDRYIVTPRARAFEQFAGQFKGILQSWGISALQEP